MKNKLLSRLTPAQLIEELHVLGSVSKIALKYNINPITVYSAFKIINYDCHVRKNISKIINKEILEEAYNRLGSLKAVARELNCDPGSIKTYMEKFGLPFKKQIIYGVNHEFFLHDNEDSFYIAGFLAADGCVKQRTMKYNTVLHEVYLGLSKIDKSFLELIKNKLQAETPIRDFLVENSKRNSKWNDTWKSEISITSKIMFDSLARFNIVPRKSLIYTFPEWLKTHPLKHHFIRGYNDGDGSFYIPKLKGGRTVEQIYFSLEGTPSFLLDIRNILEQECNLEKRNTDIRKVGKIGVLQYGGNGILSKIVDYLYKDATIYLSRKYEIAVKAK